MSDDFDFGLFGVDEFLDGGKDAAANDYPLLPLRETVVFPQMMTPLAIGRDRYRVHNRVYISNRTLKDPNRPAGRDIPQHNASVPAAR